MKLVGMRGQPCVKLYQWIHMRTPRMEWVCIDHMKDPENIDRSKCPDGAWCPIVGDKRTSIVKKGVILDAEASQ